ISPSADMEKVLGEAKVFAPRRVIPLGVDPQKFVPAAHRSQAKEKLGFSPLDIVIGYTGRLAREKNVGFLLQLFETLQAKYPSLKLLLVGSGVKDFQTRIESNSAIRAVGQMDDVVPYLQAMDLFCMPSETETSSLSSMEAMATGLPVVANAVGCLREYLFHSHNGFLAVTGDQADYQLHVERLIKDRALRQAMGAQARETMLTRFSWDQTAEAMGDLFEEILGSRSVQYGKSLTSRHFVR
ncbi:MAG: glycosyltransferase family 4 protein, partial [bacterium]